MLKIIAILTNPILNTTKLLYEHGVKISDSFTLGKPACFRTDSATGKSSIPLKMPSWQAIEQSKRHVMVTRKTWLINNRIYIINNLLKAYVYLT